MRIRPIRKDIREYLHIHQLEKKWEKSSCLFEANPKYPSLEMELLEPHWRGIYSFRLDAKFRALFFFLPDGNVEVFRVTNHYKK